MPAPHQLKTSLRFRGLKQEAWVVITLVFVVVLIEFALRSQTSNLSGNIQHIGQIPAIASRLAQQSNSMLFLGNSLTNNGIETSIFQARQSGLNAAIVEKITPDATSLSDWYCVFKNNVAELDTPPRVVVLGFAWLQLSDQYPINASRLGGYFCSIADVASLSGTGLTNHNKLLDFLAGAGSHVYLSREAIRNRLLDALVPNYRSVAQEMNVNPGLRTKEKIEKIEYNYTTLVRFSQMARDADVNLVLVAMPVKDEYPIDPGLMETVKNHGITLLDMRHTPGLTSSMYLDQIHLNASGRRHFSLALAHALPDVLRRIDVKTGTHGLASTTANRAH